jgi:NAD(P)-dependent dehydrogenase (short-subunit alcohol dehydrogenase family)
MSLADDWGVYGITANYLVPGWFKTEQTAVLFENRERVEYICDRIPLKRPGEPHDLNGKIVFLASDPNKYIID